MTAWWVAILASLLALSVFDVQSLDVWFHLKTGEYVLSAGSWPSADPFSYSAAQNWVAHEWLAGVLYALLFRAGGVPALVVFNALLLTACLQGLFLVCLLARPRRLWHHDAVWLPAAGLVFVAYLAMRFTHRIFIRPDEFTLLFTTGALLAIAISRQHHPRALWTLPALQLLWTNLHGGGSIIGVAIATLLLLGELVAQRRTPDRERLGIVAIAFATTGLAWLLNPYGWRVPLYFLHAFGEQSKDIVEWRHTGLHELVGPFGLLLGLSACAVWQRRRRLHPADLMIAAFLCLLGLDYVRLVPVGCIGAVPLACWPLWRLAARARRRSRLRFAAPVGTAVLLATAVWMGVSDALTFGSSYRFGLGVNEHFLPVNAARFVRQNEIQGPMFNSFGFGGYLMWTLPDQKVFIDGRVDNYGEAFVGRYRMFPRKDIWDGLVGEYNFNFALVDNEPEYVCETLDASPDWALVYFDDRALVYVRRNARNAEVMRRFAFHFLKPNDRNFADMSCLLAQTADREAVVAELTRGIEQSPANLNAHLMRAWFCSRLGTSAGSAIAVDDYDAVLAVLPTRADLWRQRGMALIDLRKYEEARKSLQTAVHLAPGDFESHHRLSVACYMLGDREAAIRECRAALAINPRSEAAARNLVTFTGAAR